MLRRFAVLPLPLAALVFAAASPAAAQLEPERLLPPEIGAASASAPRATDVDAPAPARWPAPALRQLLGAIDASAGEGLRPADYRRDELAAAIDAGAGGAGVDMLAEAAARALAHDYAAGRIDDRARFDWHIEQSPDTLATLDADLDAAVSAGRVRAYLDGLLPRDPRYGALRVALAETPAANNARREHIRASMERWRWMPRTLGDDYVMVNVPAYRLTLFKDAGAVSSHDVVVGAPRTPTPMIATEASSVVVNPWWTLPPSVLAEGRSYPAAKGFVTASAGGRTVIRQKPGPGNALGRMKFDMPNQYAIYLHDTPAKAAFARSDRALSHGCIRVKDIAGLADALAPTPAVRSALDGTATQTVPLERRVPVYIVYFTAGEQDGRVVTFADPYARDAALNAALDGRSAGPEQRVAAAI